MKKLYRKNELTFALVWIAIYVVVMNIAMNLCGGFDHLESKTPGEILAPVFCILLLAVWLTGWIAKQNLTEKYGLCRFRGKPISWLFFLPLILMSGVNLMNGVGYSAPVAVSLLMMVNMAAAGYVEEPIFRGFLFRAMEKENLRSAIIVSSVTFGVGHLVNLMNTADTFGVILQVCYAVVIGFLFTVMVYKGKSLWPSILSHVFINGSSVFAREDGWFSKRIAALFGETAYAEPLCSALLIILLAGGYAWWLWKKAE